MEDLTRYEYGVFANKARLTHIYLEVPCWRAFEAQSFLNKNIEMRLRPGCTNLLVAN